MSSVACAKCLKSQTELTNPLRRCSRCLQARYCSTDCQRADWPQHKRSCASKDAAKNTESRYRATCRLHIPGERLLENETIFFVKKKIPHLNDVTMAGPFYPRETIVEQFRGYFNKTSMAGMSLMDDIAEDEEKLHQLIHVQAPFDADPTKFMLVEVVEQHNPVIAAYLPGPAYNVVSQKTLYPTSSAGRHTVSNSSQDPKARDMEVLGCFVRKNEAITKAKEVVLNLEKTLDKSRVRVLEDNNVHTVTGVGLNNQPVSYIVEIKYDSGIIRQT